MNASSKEKPAEPDLRQAKAKVRGNPAKPDRKAEIKKGMKLAEVVALLGEPGAIHWELKAVAIRKIVRVVVMFKPAMLDCFSAASVR